MIEKIEEWIHQVNKLHEPKRRSCSVFQRQFDGFYSPEFLQSAYFVIVDELPKPDYPELREAGFGSFIDMEAAGITYQDTYYVQARVSEELRLHFHELVHVLQWRELGTKGFILRYMDELVNFGYEQSPLEKMAYSLDAHYGENGRHLNVEQYVRENL